MPSRSMSVCGTGSKVGVNIDGFLLFAERILKKKAKIYPFKMKKKKTFEITRQIQEIITL